MRAFEIAALCVFSSLSVITECAARSEDLTRITVGVEGAFPPSNATTPGGELEGLDLDVMREVCMRARLECDIVAQNWDSQIPALIAGKFDVILTVGPNPERRKVIDFTDPYVITPNTFLVRADGHFVDLPHADENLSIDTATGVEAVGNLRQALEGAKLGGSLATSQLEFLHELFGGTASIRSYRSSEQVALDREGGRLDAQFDNVVFALDRAARSEGMLTVAGPSLTGGNMATDVCLGVRKDRTDLRDRLNAALTSMRLDGTLSEISLEWFGVDLSPP